MLVTRQPFYSAAVNASLSDSNALCEKKKGRREMKRRSRRARRRRTGKWDAVVIIKRVILVKKEKKCEGGEIPRIKVTYGATLLFPDT